MSYKDSQKLIGYIACGLSSLAIVTAVRMPQAEAVRPQAVSTPAPAPATTSTPTPAPAPTSSVRFGFKNITGNSATNAATGESQLFLDVTQGSLPNQVLFTFNNFGQKASSITQIYFDQTTNLLKNINSITNSGSGVDFVIPKNIGTLPGSNHAPGGRFNSDFSIEANQPVSQMGVNPGEFVSALFNLNSNITFDNIINSLKNGVLRVGFHVQAFGDGGSEAFANNLVVVAPTPTPTPTPATYYQPTPVPPLPRKVPEPSTIGALSLFAAGIFGIKKKNKKDISQT